MSSRFLALAVCLAISPNVFAASPQSGETFTNPVQKQTSQNAARARSDSRKVPPADARRGSTPREYHAAPVQPYHAQTIEPYHAQSLEPYHAQPIQAHSAQPVTPNGSNAVTNLREAGGESAAPAASATRGQAAAGLAFFFRTFGLAVPGVAYTTDNYATQTRTLTTSTGVLTTSAVRIRPNHTYEWNSQWDGRLIHGYWVEKDDAVLLLHGQEGKNWLLRAKERASGGAVVTLWDQNATWYEGTPIR